MPELRYIGEQRVQPASDQTQYYSNITNYLAVTYHDIRFAIDVDKRSSFYFGVDNVINQNPPDGLTGLRNENVTAGGGSSVYDNRGRFFYAGFRLGFR